MRWTYHDGGRARAGFTGKTGDCVVRAIAIATGLPYLRVYDDLFARENAAKRRTLKRGTPRTGINKDITRAYLATFGWTFTPTMGIGTGCRVHLRDGELPSGRLIVSVSKHLCAVVDGVVYDTHDPTRDGDRCVYGYWSKP